MLPEHNLILSYKKSYNILLIEAMMQLRPVSKLELTYI
jgi:hypothetical protein